LAINKKLFSIKRLFYFSIEVKMHTFEGPRDNRNEEAPTEEEVNSAIKQLKSNKAPGFDNINSETLKA
jgi:hypothetical protein